MSLTILVADDEPNIVISLEYLMKREGYTVLVARDGQEALDMIARDRPDLVLLDVMMPKKSGFEVCQAVRASEELQATKILMLTAKGDPMDRIVGLELGADDYLPKPFEPRELLARIRAVLRRHGEGALPPDAQRLVFGSLEIDRDARSVSVAGRACELTSYQFDLLAVLAERAGRVLTRDQIMEAVRGRELEAFDRSIDVHMGRIRAAIEDDAKEPKRIVTVRGVGYVFAKQQD